MTRDELENKYWEAIEAGEKTYRDTEGDLVAAILEALEGYTIQLGEPHLSAFRNACCQKYMADHETKPTT